MNIELDKEVKEFNPNTQNQILLDYLKTHEYITIRDAWFLGISSLHRRLTDLRREGYNITEGDWIEIIKANNKTAKVKKYSLV